MAWLMGVLGSLRLYTLGVDESIAFMRLSHKVTANSSSSSCASMSVSVVFNCPVMSCEIVRCLFCRVCIEVGVLRLGGLSTEI